METIVTADVKLIYKDAFQHAIYREYIADGKLSKINLALPILFLFWLALIFTLGFIQHINIFPMTIAWALLFIYQFIKYSLTIRDQCRESLIHGVYQIHFYEDRFRIEFNSNGKTEEIEWAYPSFAQATERRGEFYLYVDRKHGEIILPKRCITQGEPEQLTRLLRRNLRDRFHV